MELLNLEMKLTSIFRRLIDHGLRRTDDLFKKFGKQKLKNINRKISLSEDYILQELKKVCDMFRKPLLHCFLFIQ